MSKQAVAADPRSDSAKVAMREWNRAYTESPELAGTFAWNHVCEVLDRYPGERVFEVGLGSGANLLWAQQHGWEVGGCDVARTALSVAQEHMPEADLRHESIVDCSAPSDRYDMVIDRAAMTYLSPKDCKKAIAHVRRILKTGGIFLFNPYGEHHEIPMPAGTPDPTLWDLASAMRLFPNTKWEVLEAREVKLRGVRDDIRGLIEHTLVMVARKIG